MKCKKPIARLLSIFFLAVLSVSFGNRAEAASRVLTPESAKSLAIMNSMEYRELRSRLSLAQLKYAEALKSTALKKKNKQTFRWSPLLRFHFPETPGFSEAAEWVYKPMQAYNEMMVLQHELLDVRLKEEEAAANLYADVYVMQETIAFTQESIERKDKYRERHLWNAYIGKEKPEETGLMEADVRKLEKDLAQQMRSCENLKQKLSEKTGMDLTVGWEFQKPFEESHLDRSILEKLKEYTLANDQRLYEKKLDRSLALSNLETNERMLKNKFGRYTYLIQPFLDQVKRGEKVELDDFKNSYDRFLEEINKRWEGDIRLLFLKIPREWFQGETDGVRYLEDDPYILYTQALEYEKLNIEEYNLRAELKASVTDQYEALTTARNAWRDLQESVEKEETRLKENRLLRKEGKVTDEELTAQQERCDESQMELLEACASYTKLLNSFDRVTCGGVSKWMEEGTVGLETSAKEDSISTGDETDGLGYLLEYQMEDSMFSFRIIASEGLESEVTHYELWVDETRVGERTSIEEPLRHLAFTMDSVEYVVVRLYEKDAYVEEYTIDPMVMRGTLK